MWHSVKTTLSIITLYHYAECRYGVLHFVIIMLNVIMPNVVMLSEVVQNIFATDVHSSLSVWSISGWESVCSVAPSGRWSCTAGCSSSRSLDLFRHRAERMVFKIVTVNCPYLEVWYRDELFKTETNFTEVKFV